LARVDQDCPRRRGDLYSATVRHRCLQDDGPFNRGACFNIGAEAPSAELLCLMDGDLWVGEDWYQRCLDAIAGWKAAGVWKGAMLPYAGACYLDAEASERVVAGAAPSRSMRPTAYASVGGVLWIERALFVELGGYDPEYKGWGAEDNDLDRRLRERIGELPRMAIPLWHLFHEEPDKSGAQANLDRLAAKESP